VIKPSTAWCEIRLHEDSCRNSTIRQCKSWRPVTASTLAHPMRRKITILTRKS